MENQHLGDNSNAALKSRIDRIIRLTEEKTAIANDIKEVFQEAKSSGDDIKALRLTVRLLLEDDAKRAERERVQAEADLMLAAMGPLGVAAVEKRR